MRKQNIKSNDNIFSLNLRQLFLLIINSVNKDHNDLNQIFVFFARKQIQIIKNNISSKEMLQTYGDIFFLIYELDDNAISTSPVFVKGNKYLLYH